MDFIWKNGPYRKPVFYRLTLVFVLAFFVPLFSSSGSLEAQEPILQASDPLPTLVPDHNTESAPTLKDSNPIANDDSAAQTKAEELSGLARFNSWVGTVLFFDLSFGAIEIDEVDSSGRAVSDKNGQPKKKQVPISFLVAFLAFGSIFFTFWYRWINIRGLKHSIDVICGKYDKPEHTGEITHFRALTSALSATIGLGNIAGVAVAIQVGGPGAVFWMVTLAVFSMTAKFSSCTLAQMYRKTNSDGSISGGPMYYLDIGLKEMGKFWGLLGKVLAVLYALMIMAGAIGGGCMFQANQTTAAVINTFSLSESSNLTVGIVLALSVGIVILGGIKRIGLTTSRVVPIMCSIYVLASLFIIIVNWQKIPDALILIVSMAFHKNAFFGGVAGVLVTGVTRAAFSNEGGLGSAAIAHAAARTNEPVREGIVGMIGPVIDTMIVCLMTGLVVVLTDVWNNPEVLAGAANLDNTQKGVTLTIAAFATVIPWFPVVLTVCIALFAYSTMISWCYYGERGWIYILDHCSNAGLKTVVIYRVVFVGFIVYGAVEKLGDVLDFSDMMILSMAFPNILGSIILAPRVLEKMKDYWSRYQAGEFDPQH